MIYQHDDALSYRFIDNIFYRILLTIEGLQTMLLSLPNLSVLDFLIVGIIKYRVYNNSVSTMEDYIQSDELIYNEKSDL